MKNITLLLSLLLSCFCYGQTIPQPSSPCQKFDTNTIKKMIVGTWVDMKDTTHVMVITPDSVEETILVKMGKDMHSDISYWNYKITDNLFSSDDVTCYSIEEYKEGYDHHVSIAINGMDAHYLLTGGEGKAVFKRIQ